MKKIKNQNTTKAAIFAGAAALMALTPRTHAQAADDMLINKLEQKGILSVDEAKELRAEAAEAETNQASQFVSASKLKIADSIKSMQLFGDVRVRYEYRGVGNFPSVVVPNYGTVGSSTFARERFRYALRMGVRGDLFDDFNYGLRLETSSNPRSPWDTFGNNTTAGSATPSDKAQSGIGVGQLFIGWHPTDWFEMTVGRMPMPLYTTPMVWDSDINPEGAFEKFKLTLGNVDWFADFGQFDYQDPTSASDFPSSDTFLLAWQAGANVRIGKDVSFKIAPMLYTYFGIPAAGYNGVANVNVLGQPYTGQGDTTGANSGSLLFNSAPSGVFNEYGINNLLVLEIPMEYDFKIWKSPLGTLQGRLFGDVAVNLQGAERASAAAAAAHLPHAELGNNKAYQVGFGVGSAGPVYGPTQGLVYGSTSKKNTWEARVYWQHIEQYALDVNLIDSDFFEGRANLEGFYAAFAYSFTDSIIGTARFGHADRINDSLGTGGNNLDIPWFNPIKNYNVAQLDLTWRF